MLYFCCWCSFRTWFCKHQKRLRKRGSIAEENFNSLKSTFDNLLHSLEEADVQPTEQLTEAVKKTNASFLLLEKKWTEFESKTFH